MFEHLIGKTISVHLDEEEIDENDKTTELYHVGILTSEFNGWIKVELHDGIARNFNLRYVSWIDEGNTTLVRRTEKQRMEVGMDSSCCSEVEL